MTDPAATRHGPGRILILVYGVFALAATARAGVQIATQFDEAPIAYLLSAVAAVIYCAATFALAKATKISRRVATVAIIVELVGVVGIGAFSYAVPDDFPDATVWSHFGQGYGFVPLVLPVIGLIWLRRTRYSRLPGNCQASAGDGSGSPASIGDMQISGHPRVEIVVPVKNEENDLGPNIRRLREFLDTAFPFPAEVCIADNGSTDATYEIGALLSAELPGVRIVRLEQSGRGRALKKVWSESTADVLAYMDVDLSTNLNALLPLVAPLFAGHSDVAIGTRLSNGSRVVRRPKREFISRSYNLLLRATLSAHFSDAQCGFKAIRADVAHQLLPLVEDNSWFFDTELLVLAEKAGLRIHEVPVDWVDDLDSRVAIAKTVGEDLRGIARLRRTSAVARSTSSRCGQAFGRPRILDPRTALAARVLRFCAIGVLSTAAYALLYLVLADGHAGPGGERARAAGHSRRQHRPQPADHLRRQRRREPLAAPAPRTRCLRHRMEPDRLVPVAAAHRGVVPHQAVEITVLTLANLAATIVRFSLFQTWVFDDDAPTLPTFEPSAVLENTRSN